MNKKLKKLIDKKCYICEEPEYAVLDVHRILWGESYSKNNTVALCVKCHRRIHCIPPQIIIYGWKMSTKGRVLHYMEEGVEKFK